MSNNVVIKGKENQAIFVFDFDISGYTEMTVDVGGESYSTVTNPTLLFVDGTTDLVLDIGLVSTIPGGSYPVTICADGVTLTGACKIILREYLVVC